MNTSDTSDAQKSTGAPEPTGIAELQEATSGLTAATTPQAPRASGPQHSQPDAGPALDHLLQMADTYRGENSLRQAMEIYFELAEAHGDTPQGQHARQWLMAIAEQYEFAGNRRQARSIYERLL